MIDRTLNFARQRGVIFGLVAIAAVMIRLTPLIRSDIHFAFPSAPRSPRARGGLVDDVEAWRWSSVHNDSYEYLQLADGLVHGCGFARRVNARCEAAELLRTPGYPLFLALMPGIRSTLAAQALIGGAACLLLAWWINSRWGFNAALTAELLLALDVPWFVLSNQVMSETLFAALLLLGAFVPLLAIRYARGTLAAATVAGLACGFAILVRPIGLVLPLLVPIPFIFAARISARGRLLAMAITLVLSLLAPIGWAVRNFTVTGYFGLSTIGAINIYFYRAANVIAREQGQGLEETRTVLERRLGVPFDRVYDPQEQRPELARRMNHLALGILVAHPLTAAAMTVQSTLYLALCPIRTQLARVAGTTGGSKGLGLSAGAPSLSRVALTMRRVLGSPVLAALEFCQIALLAVVWIGIARALLACRHAATEYRVWCLYLTALTLILLLLAAGGEADVRFRVPVAPLMAAVAGLGYFAGYG